MAAFVFVLVFFRPDKKAVSKYGTANEKLCLATLRTIMVCKLDLGDRTKKVSLVSVFYPHACRSKLTDTKLMGHQRDDTFPVAFCRLKVPRHSLLNDTTEVFILSSGGCVQILMMLQAT